MPRTTPRFTRSERRRDGRELLAPLPPLLVEKLGADSKPLVEHQRVADVSSSWARLPQTQASVKTAKTRKPPLMRTAVRAAEM